MVNNKQMLVSKHIGSRPNAKVKLNLSSDFHILLPFKLPSSQIPHKCLFLLLFSLIKCIAFVRHLFDYISKSF